MKPDCVKIDEVNMCPNRVFVICDLLTILSIFRLCFSTSITTEINIPTIKGYLLTLKNISIASGKDIARSMYIIPNSTVAKNLSLVKIMFPVVGTPIPVFLFCFSILTFISKLYLKKIYI